MASFEIQLLTLWFCGFHNHEISVPFQGAVLVVCKICPTQSGDSFIQGYVPYLFICSLLFNWSKCKTFKSEILIWNHINTKLHSVKIICVTLLWIHPLPWCIEMNVLLWNWQGMGMRWLWAVTSAWYQSHTHTDTHMLWIDCKCILLHCIEPRQVYVNVLQLHIPPCHHPQLKREKDPTGRKEGYPQTSKRCPTIFTWV